MGDRSSAGHDVDASDEDNGNSDGSVANTLKVVATASDSVTQKRRRGAPKMKKQKRVSHLYTELVCSAKSRSDLLKRRSTLDFVLKKISNNSKLSYYKCVTHKNCNYTELVWKGEPGTGYHAHVFTKKNPQHALEFAQQCNRANGISERWIRVVDTLVESGRTPMQIRTHLLLQANKLTGADKLLAMKCLPKGRQVASRKRVLMLKKKGKWNLEVNADLINFYRSSFIETREQFDAVKVKSTNIFRMTSHVHVCVCTC